MRVRRDAASSSPAPARRARRALRILRRLHCNERGTISILTVFAAFALTMVLGMVMNVGRQVDSKIRMQNAADSAAYSGGVVLARGMNTLAFTNHMLCDTFALTAFLREGRDRNAESKVPDILAAWTAVGKVFAETEVEDSSVHGLPPLKEKIPALGQAILAKVPHEQEMVQAYSDWAAAAAERLLPLFEDILAYEMIPEYQRAIVAALPDVAQRATLEVARRHGKPERDRGPMLGMLWTGSGIPVAGGGGIYERALPVVDPVMDAASGDYLQTAREKREQRARRYLDELNSQALAVFGGVPNGQSMFLGPVQMSQFNRLWDGYTCGQMMKLLNDEYPFSNLPFLIRTTEREVLDQTTAQAALMDDDFTFVAVVYAKQQPEMFSGLFVNPIEGDALTFAQIRMFVPWRRLQFWSVTTGGSQSNNPFEPKTSEPGEADRWVVGRQEWRTLTDTDTPVLPDRRNAWDLFNQSWAVALVPATHYNLVTILQTAPPISELTDYQLPSLGGLSIDTVRTINTH